MKLEWDRRYCAQEGEGEGEGEGGGSAGEGLQPEPADWRASLPEELRAEPSLQGVPDVATLAKNFVNTKRMVGSSVRIPGKDASEEQLKAFREDLKKVPGATFIPDSDDAEGMSAFYASLGRPDAPDKYPTPKLPSEDLELDEALLNTFKGEAFKMGMTTKQYEQTLAVQIAFQQAQADAIRAHREQAKQTLTKAWGQDYDRRMGVVSAVLQNEKLGGGPELVEALKQHPIADIPQLAIFLEKVGQGMLEDPIVTGRQGGEFAATTDEIEESIAEIRNNAEHPYHDKRKPGHDASVRKVSAMYEELSRRKRGAA